MKPTKLVFKSMQQNMLNKEVMRKEYFEHSKIFKKTVKKFQVIT
jgi:hypothetical protein